MSGFQVPWRFSLTFLFISKFVEVPEEKLHPVEHFPHFAVNVSAECVSRFGSERMPDVY